MSENSPRWPGSNGAPGLDFSPYRTPADETQPLAAVDRPAVPVGAPAEAPAGAAGSARAGAAGVAAAGSASGPASEATQAWSAAPVTEPIPAHVPTESLPTASASAPAAEQRPATRAPRPAHRTRKARLRLARLDPWSVMKTTFLFSIAFGVMMVVATFALWSVLAGSGALESLNTLINTLISSEQEGGSFKIEDYLSVQRILGFSVVVAAIDVVIITAVATLFAFLYNLSAVVMGGLEVTLAED